MFTSTGNTSAKVGGVVGAAVEYAFTQNRSGKVEYLHTFYGDKSLAYTNDLGQTFTTNAYNFDTNVVRVGLNYKC
jgi:outer membrane immunogenic protein